MTTDQRLLNEPTYHELGNSVREGSTAAKEILALRLKRLESQAGQLSAASGRLKKLVRESTDKEERRRYGREIAALRARLGACREEISKACKALAQGRPS